MIIMNRSYNKGGKGKVAVYNDHHEVLTKEEVETKPRPFESVK